MVVPVKRYPPGYGVVEPVADYRPWDVDTAFRDIYHAVTAHTKVDIYRCYALWRYAAQTAALQGDLLEVGVWRGGSAAVLAAALRHFGVTDKTIYLADTFCGVVKAGPRDDYYKGGEHADASADTVHELFARLEIDHYRLLCGVFPDQTAHQIPAGTTFSFCHVDVDVYQSARDACDWVWPRLTPGGMVVYDDYGFYGCEGVTAAGNEEFARPDRIVTHNLNGQCVLVRISP